MRNLARVIQAPKQERSRRTFSNLLDATRELLATNNFDDIAVSDITGRAGVSTGSFYARFPDKIALLLALQERSLTEIRERLARQLDPDKWADKSLSKTVAEMIRSLVEIPDRHVPIFKAAMFGALREPLLAMRVTEITEFKVELISRLVLSKKAEISVADPAAIAVSGARMIEAILQHRRIRAYVETKPYFIPNGSLCRELSEMYLSYLGIRPEASDRKTSPPRRTVLGGRR
jgi:AcrR family transcriptional regulator